MGGVGWSGSKRKGWRAGRVWPVARVDRKDKPTTMRAGAVFFTAQTCGSPPSLDPAILVSDCLKNRGRPQAINTEPAQGTAAALPPPQSPTRSQSACASGSRQSRHQSTQGPSRGPAAPSAPLQMGARANMRGSRAVAGWQEEGGAWAAKPSRHKQPRMPPECMLLDDLQMRNQQ